MNGGKKYIIENNVFLTILIWWRFFAVRCIHCPLFACMPRQKNRKKSGGMCRLFCHSTVSQVYVCRVNKSYRFVIVWQSYNKINRLAMWYHLERKSMCYKCNVHLVTKSLFSATHSLCQWHYEIRFSIDKPPFTRSHSVTIILAFARSLWLPTAKVHLFFFWYIIMVTSMILMMINVQIWNMKMGSLCSEISDLCNWQCLFPCQTNQTALRLSTHVANDWWGFYCDYVVLSLAHPVTHSGIHPAAKLSWWYWRTHAKNVAVLLKVMRISIVNRRMTNDLSCDFLGRLFSTLISMYRIHFWSSLWFQHYTHMHIA